MNIFDDIIEGISNGNNHQISVITDIDPSRVQLNDVELNEEAIPILPLRNMMLFPGTMVPVNVARRSSLKLLNESMKQNKPFGVFCQKDDSVDDPDFNSLYPTGVLAKAVKIFELPDGSKTALLHGHNRVRLVDANNIGEYLMGHVSAMPEEMPAGRDKEFVAIVEACKDVASKFLRSLGDIPQAEEPKLRNTASRISFLHFLCSNIPISNKERIALLEIDGIRLRAYRLLELLNREYQFASLKANIQNKTHEELTKQQREYFLQQEMRNIQEELGGGAQSEYERFKELAKTKKWSKETEGLFMKELERLHHYSPGNSDYHVQYAYIETLLSLPWMQMTKDNLNLQNAERVLNKDHYGLEKVKERILEHLAVLKLRGDFKSPIICLYGPPGVGKTSLGKSIAKAMKRKYVRMSLGGVHDEAEIRGHRKTYVGAMPGRIIKCIQKAESSNPVFILDEIDKVGQEGMNGDPSSALLEVLDPEQNVAFHDNYLDCDYDLSNVMFIATANNISTIPAPLLDRMELIEVSGYLTEEKIEIAKRHLIPQEMEKLGLKDCGALKKTDKCKTSQIPNIRVTNQAIEKIIEDYTRESGVRELDKQINKLLRKTAFEIGKESVNDYDSRGGIVIGRKEVQDILGPKRYSRDQYQGNDYAGVVTGLAWTAVGGEILFIETSLSRGKGGKLTLTGNLGDVMKESATLALEYIKAHSDLLGIDYRVFDNWNIHIHVPEGAVPKDGPSAGITITTAIASALTQRKVRANLAMTGEMTLRGKVLPVGGIKEKILAAKRAGITDIIICEENEKDIKQIPVKYLDGVSFHYVKDFMDVVDFALLDEKVKKPLDLTVSDSGSILPQNTQNIYD
ncbi:MAG: endopeptidase La [Bacteroidaceae bacterium]|nr:endopeptidase La [Bacteroidaceae bacterium]